MQKQTRDAKSIDRNNFNILNTKKNPIAKSNSNKLTQQKSETTLATESSEAKKPKTPKDSNAVINTSNKQSTNSTHNPNYKEIEKEKEKKFFKFQNMSKLIVNKIDDILGSYSTPGYASSSISNYSDTLGLSKNILNNIETNLQIAEENELLRKLASKNAKYTSIPMDSVYSNASGSSTSRKKLSSAGNLKKNLSENIKNKDNNDFKIDKKENKDFEKSEKQAKEINKIISEIQKEKAQQKGKSGASDIKDKKSKGKKKSENKAKNRKDVFMTKVEIEGEIKSSSEEEEVENKMKFEEEDLFDSSDEDIKVNPELRKEMNDFRNMINEINDLKRGMQTEFDELQFLIKYVDGTSTRVNRHMNGISNLFQQSGLKPKSDNILHRLREDPEESADDLDGKNNNFYDKVKNMDRIKDNLIHLQDNFIGYYKNFDGGMKNIETNVAKCKHMLLYEKNNKDEKINL